jgi:hypothetical protein
MSAKKVLCLILFPLMLSACGSTPSWDGYSPAEATALQGMGISAEEAKRYQAMGFNSFTIQQWFDEGIPAQQNITAWHDEGFNAQDAGGWHAAGFTLRDADDWRGANFNAANAKKYKEQGVTLKAAKKMRKQGVPLKETISRAFLTLKRARKS